MQNKFSQKLAIRKKKKHFEQKNYRRESQYSCWKLLWNSMNCVFCLKFPRKWEYCSHIIFPFHSKVELIKYASDYMVKQKKLLLGLKIACLISFHSKLKITFYLFFLDNQHAIKYYIPINITTWIYIIYDLSIIHFNWIGYLNIIKILSNVG